jgi:hypothetical protein
MFPIIQRVVSTVPAQLVVGGVLGWLVWAVFKRLNALSPLLGHDAGLREWLNALSAELDRLLGPEYFSWRCFWRFLLASLCVTVTAWLCMVQSENLRQGLYVGPNQFSWPVGLLMLVVLMNLLLDYPLLAKSRYLWKTATEHATWGLRLLLIADAVVCIAIRTGPIYIWEQAEVNRNFAAVTGIAAAKVPAYFERAKEVIRTSYLAPDARESVLGAIDAKRRGQNFKAAWLLYRMWWIGCFAIPTCLTILSSFLVYLWLALCVGSATLLRHARRFGIDVNTHPEGSFAIAAGTIVAIAYWSVVALSQML